MKTTWIKTSHLGNGGSAVSIAAAETAIWIGSPAGLFTADTDTGTIRPVVHEIPFSSVHAVTLAGDTLLAAGLPANLIYSSDNGKHWLRATIEGADRPFTSLAPSPNVLHDGVVLAGTAGQGLMRSSDGGRYWEFVTFGLEDYNVLVVACAPVWDAAQNGQEIALAGAANGVYQSPNGGRAWRKCQQPEGAIVQAICFSPDFETSQTVFAGTEAHGLLVSADAGLSWQLHSDIPTDLSVTALTHSSGQLIAATGTGEIYASADNGKSWGLQQKIEHPIACLAKAGTGYIVGLVGGGVQKIRTSETHQLDGALRRFDRLVIADDCWEADEIGIGRWVSKDQGKSWQQTASLSSLETIDPPLDNVLTHTKNGAVTIGADRKTVEVWLQSGSGEPWQKVGAHIAYGRTPRLAIVGSGDAVALALGPDCHILRQGSWQSFRVGSEGSPLTSIIGRPDGQIACSTFDQLHLFDGQSWETVPAADDKPLCSLAITAENEMLALTTDGVIYRLSTET